MLVHDQRGATGNHCLGYSGCNVANVSKCGTFGDAVAETGRAVGEVYSMFDRLGLASETTFQSNTRMGFELDRTHSANFFL